MTDKNQHSGDWTTIPRGGPGGGFAGLPAIVLLATYLVIIIALCLYGLIVFWPVPTPSGEQAPGQVPSPAPVAQINSATSAESAPKQPESTTPSTRQTPAPRASATPGHVTAFGHDFEVWDEVRLLCIVMLAGALGSLVHAVRSVYWYVGNRILVWSWLAKYMLMPFGGSALAVVFYFVIRGGFFSPQAGFSQTSPFGFAALSAIVGMFSEQAVLKLKQIAGTVFINPEDGADSQPKKK